MAVATSLTGYFEGRFAWRSSLKQESIQRLPTWAAPQEKEGVGTPEVLLHGVAQQLESLGQKALNWGLHDLDCLMYGYRYWEQIPGT